jgi:hypothetical protein
MRPPRIHSLNSSRIAVIATVFLILFPMTVILASAQDEVPQKKLKKGTIHRENKVVVQQYAFGMFRISGVWYKLLGVTEFLDSSGERISKKSIPTGSLVNIVYVTDKDATEEYQFNPRDKVILKLQVVATTTK